MRVADKNKRNEKDGSKHNEKDGSMYILPESVTGIKQKRLKKDAKKNT